MISNRLKCYSSKSLKYLPRADVTNSCTITITGKTLLSKPTQKHRKRTHTYTQVFERVKAHQYTNTRITSKSMATASWLQWTGWLALKLVNAWGQQMATVRARWICGDSTYVTGQRAG